MTDYKALPQYSPFFQSFIDSMILTNLITLTGDFFTVDGSGCPIMPIKDVEWNGAESLLQQRYLTLADTAIFIAYRLGKSKVTLEKMPEIFLDAIEHGQLDPREKFHLVPLSQSRLHTLENVRGDWLLTPKEVLAYAVRQGWPEEVFAELVPLSGQVGMSEESKETSSEATTKENTLNRELKQGIREIWEKENRPEMKAFFPKILKKYINKKGSPITDVYTSGEDAGISVKTSSGTIGTRDKKTISNWVSEFKKDYRKTCQ